MQIDLGGDSAVTMQINLACIRAPVIYAYWIEQRGEEQRLQFHSCTGLNLDLNWVLSELFSLVAKVQ